MGLGLWSSVMHIAIVMDGNRRWATEKGLPAEAGHKQGVDALKALVRHCGQRGDIDSLTVYAFSTENWQRTEKEVGFLMRLFVEALSRELDALHQEGVRLRFVGDLPGLPEALQKAITEAHTKTANNTGLQFNVAMNYGSRAELANACQQLAQSTDPITEAAVEQHLWTAPLTDIDILIRTGGEQRLSNFLLWQAAYAELFFTETPWPAFTPTDFDAIIASYTARQRRFGR